MNARDPDTKRTSSLERECRRAGVDPEIGPAGAAQWRVLRAGLEQRCEESERALYLLERSQALASDETDRAIAAIQQQAQALHRSELRLASLLSLSADWVWEQDADLRFVYLSEGFERMQGVPAAALLGWRIEECLAFEQGSGAGRTLQAQMAAREPFRDLHVSVADGGDQRNLVLSGAPVFDAADRFTGYRGVGRDTTESTRLSRRIQRLAEHDDLTGLLNRHGVLARLDARVAQAAVRHGGFAVLLVGLDRFKAVNDVVGHEAGDHLLSNLARRIQSVVRDGDTLGRIGSDEFVVGIECAEGSGAARLVADKLLSSIAQPVDVGGRLVRVTCSIGIAQFPAHARSGNALLSCAGRAMQAAKRGGRNDVRLFQSADTAAEHDEARIEIELVHALERDELVLHYQPQLAADGGGVVGLEALVRWRHPVEGLLMPHRFVAIAESRGLSARLDLWVLESACRQMAAWRDAGFRLPRMAVNVSPRTFSDSRLPRRVQTLCERYGLSPASLELEITEQVLLETPAHTLRVLARLRELGVRVAIDDFGTGYSSLSYLKAVRPQCLKIDRSFVSGLADDEDDRSITGAIIGLAKSLKLEVIAEGVETEAQRALLAALGCDLLQGYLLGRPVPATAIALEREKA